MNVFKPDIVFTYGKLATSPSKSTLHRLWTRSLSWTQRIRQPTSIWPHQQQHRQFHLAPPFLLDDPYIPHFRTLSGGDVARKRAAAQAHLAACNLCPRKCNVNRYEKVGVCLIGERAKVNVIAPHFGEEPCIQGHNGSGSVFFSGCSLKCTFCQNHDISHVPNGQDLTPEELAEWYIKLQDVGKVHNINLVTPEHVAPQVAMSILAARDLGLKIPIVYNTSSYDSMESLQLMDGLVDIYLADFKTWTSATSKRLLKAGDYPETAKEGVREMQRQVGHLCFTGDGIAKRGLLIRHLVMPAYVEEGKEIMRWLAKEVGRDVFVNIMEQYRPAANVGKPMGRHGGDETDGRLKVRYEEINRPVRLDEVGAVRKAAEEAGIWRFNEGARHDGFNV